jgi:hypothetical protein
MKEIQLTKGEVALVDDEDFDYLNSFKWHCSAFGYALCSSGSKDGKRNITRMHRWVNETPNDMETDHINGNRLDNRSSNLRSVTHSQNAINKNVHNPTGYRGVEKRGNSWRACITVDYKKIRLSSHRSPVEAAKDYDELAKQYHGSMAVLNFPDSI